MMFNSNLYLSGTQWDCTDPRSGFYCLHVRVHMWPSDMGRHQTNTWFQVSRCFFSLVRWHCVFANVNVPGNCQEVERSLSRNKSQDWVLLCGSALLLSLRWKFPHSWTRTCRTITSPNHSPRWVSFVILLSLKCINIKLKCNKYIIHDIIKLNSAPAKRNLSTIWSQVLECISRTLVALYCLSWSPLTFLQGGSDRWQGNANCRQGPSQSVQWGASWGPEHDGTAGEGGEAGKPKAITSFWDTDFLDRNI